jgi:hypothetical protein
MSEIDEINKGGVVGNKRVSGHAKKFTTTDKALF